MAARVYSVSMTQSTHSPAHSLVAVASHSPDVRLCDLNSATCSHTLTGHQGAPHTSVALSRRDPRPRPCEMNPGILVCRGRVSCFEKQQVVTPVHRSFSVVAGRADAVTSVRWLPCSDWELMSASRDGAVKQWDVRKTFPCLRSLNHHSTQVGLRSTLLSPPPAGAYWPPEPSRAQQSRGRRPSVQTPAPALWQRPQGSAANMVGSVIRRDSKAMQKWSAAGKAGHPSASPSHFKNGAYIRAHEGAATCVRPVLNGLFLLSAGESQGRSWCMAVPSPCSAEPLM